MVPGSWSGNRFGNQQFYSDQLEQRVKERTQNLQNEIEERKLVENKLTESELHYRTIGETIPYGVWLTEANGYCTYVSPSFLEMVGMNLDQIQQFGWLHLLPPEDMEPTKEQWMHSVQTGEDFEREHLFRSKNGRYRNVLAIGRPVKDDTGKIIRWVGLNIDITERKKAEEALRDSEERFRRALDLGVVGMATTNPYTYRFLSANKRLCEMVGYTEKELLQKTWVEITQPKDKIEEDKAGVKKIVDGEAQGYIMEKQYIHKDGHPIDITLSVQGVRKGDGTADYLVILIDDITDRKKAEEALRKSHAELEVKVKERTRDLEIKMKEAEDANRLKSEFLANMSHELRTPLNSIIVLSNVLKEERIGKEQDYEHLEVIERNGRKLLELINDIMNLSRIESGQMELRISSFSLGVAIKEITEGIMPMAEAKGLSIRCDIDPDMPLINSDDKLVYSIFQNLMSNAVKFMESGEVQVSAGCAGRYFQVRVEDTGIGISQDDLPHVFETFRQADGSLTRRHEGTGLGLALAKQGAKLLGGDISVESEPGKGSVFTLTLPISSQDIVEEHKTLTEEETQPQMVKHAIQPGSKRTVLIVEDNPDNMLVLRATLYDRYKLLEAADGEQALEKALSEHPDLILLDMALPGISGFEVVKRLRADNKASTIPVIALTAHAMQGDREKCLEAGCDDYISKPLNVDELLDSSDI